MLRRTSGRFLRALQGSRLLSTDAQIKVTAISKSLSLREVSRDENASSKSGDKLPLVLMFDWLYAKPAHLAKYAQLYHNLGLDVLTVHGKLVHFLWPPKGMTFGEELLKYLLETREGRDSLIVHAFSVGAYNYTICMLKALEEAEKFGKFRSQVCGQIFDSIVIGSYDNMSIGISEALSPATRKPVVKLMNTYYHMTEQTTKENYGKLVDTFKTKPICVPTLVFYSHNDPMCDVSTMIALEKQWREEVPNFDVTFKSWEKSVHAAHMKFHAEEYLEEWNKLMTKLKLMDTETQRTTL